MIALPKCKEFIDREMIRSLEKLRDIITVADLGMMAKVSDVTKVKKLINKRIEKLRGTTKVQA